MNSVEAEDTYDQDGTFILLFLAPKFKNKTPITGTSTAINWTPSVLYS